MSSERSGRVGTGFEELDLRSMALDLRSMAGSNKWAAGQL
jgi:hypothetical protein